MGQKGRRQIADVAKRRENGAMITLQRLHREAVAGSDLFGGVSKSQKWTLTPRYLLVKRGWAL